MNIDMLEYLRKSESASFTFTRTLCHIADLMEGNMQQCRQYIMKQDALLETILDHFQKQKSQVMERELSDFVPYSSTSDFIAKMSRIWLTQKLMEVAMFMQFQKKN